MNKRKLVAGAFVLGLLMSCNNSKPENRVHTTKVGNISVTVRVIPDTRMEQITYTNLSKKPVWVEDANMGGFTLQNYGDSCTTVRSMDQ